MHPKGSIFFISSCSHSCFSLHFSKQKAKKYKRMELNTRAKLEIAITNLHEDIYNKQKKRKCQPTKMDYRIDSG